MPSSGTIDSTSIAHREDRASDPFDFPAGEYNREGRRHFVPTIGFFILSTLLAGSVTVSQRNSTVTYKGSVDFGPQEILVGRECYVFGGLVSSEDFFDGLSRTDRNGKIEYKRIKQVIENYPDRLEVTIRLAVGECRPQNQTTPEDSRIENMWKALNFEAQWKDETRIRPALHELIGARQLASSTYPIEGENFRMRVYEYDLKVPAQGVRLADHLIISVHMPGEQALVRLSAQP